MGGKAKPERGTVATPVAPGSVRVVQWNALGGVVLGVRCRSNAGAAGSETPVPRPPGAALHAGRACDSMVQSKASHAPRRAGPFAPSGPEAPQDDVRGRPPLGKNTRAD